MRPDLQMIRQPEEIERLAAFAEEVWHEHYDPLLGSAQVDYMVEKFQSAPALAEQLKNGYEYYAVVDKESGEMMGFCGIRPEPRENRQQAVYWRPLPQNRTRDIGTGISETICA